MYLISKRKPKCAHLWDGTDTVCHTIANGGHLSSYSLADEKGYLPLCQNCINYGKTSPHHVAIKEAKKTTARHVKSTPVANCAHGCCRKCGLPIIWGKSKFGKPMPLNPDSSEHWDKCSEARTRARIESGHVFLPIASEWVKGKDYVGLTEPAEGLPWED